MIPLAKPASCFSAVRLPIILLRSIASGSPLKSGVKLLQQSIEPPFRFKKGVLLSPRTVVLLMILLRVSQYNMTLKVNLYSAVRLFLQDR
jgi:hypothetical protein